MAGTGGHFGPESVACFAPEWVVAFRGILKEGQTVLDKVFWKIARAAYGLKS
ncbi:MAG: hypothetical protein WCF05_12485 [Chromatiaceae bacterium]